MAAIRVTVWGENVHDRLNPVVQGHYPEGMHATIAAHLCEDLGAAVEVRTATLDEPEHGLSEDVLEATDVLTWWGHAAHDEVHETVAQRVQARVLAGMGLLVLHSGHLSKPFRRLMGTSCSLRYREADDHELLWVVDPAHPVAAGLGPALVLGHHEMYGEPFDVPAPDELVFISWFSGGEVFRSGCSWRRGAGRVFYLSPGHETIPVYHHPGIRRVMANAIRYLAPPEPPPAAPRLEAVPARWFEATAERTAAPGGDARP